MLLGSSAPPILLKSHSEYSKRIRASLSSLISIALFIQSDPFSFFTLFQNQTMSIVEVRVPNLDCEGCAAKIKKALFKLDGVEEVEAEIETQKITVRGYGVEEKKVLKAVRRAGKSAEPWPFPGYSHYTSFYKYPTHIVNHYYESANNGANASVHTFFNTPSTYSMAVASDEAVASLFSDENPHACTIM